MDFDRYQSESRKTAIYPGQGESPIYPILGLCGETGEIAEKYKKVLRDKEGEIDGSARDALAKELGDVLWYLAQIATEIGIPLNTIATLNLAKLADRQSRGVLGGSGDNR
jgi:NTP pyrophosphatase (non-canonical NTP hydrolase)